MPKHKHYDVIVAAAEGKAIQWRDKPRSDWLDAGSNPFANLAWHDDHEYRVKPIDRASGKDLQYFYHSVYREGDLFGTFERLQESIIARFIEAHKGETL